jgi:hypothetical protein
MRQPKETLEIWNKIDVGTMWQDYETQMFSVTGQLERILLFIM